MTDKTDTDECLPDDRLKPCPFCGDLGWVEGHGMGAGWGQGVGWRVECQGSCHGMTCYWHSVAEAIEHWNMRPSADAERAARIKAEAELETLKGSHTLVAQELAAVNLELKELREAANALVDLHNGPTERKRPDVFQRLMSRLARAVGGEG